jgi:hypothetical protein
MIAFLRHLIRVHQANKHEREKSDGITRSPHWRTVEKHHLEAHPTCAACGGRTKLQVHHEKPFHSHPELELDERNLITLCMDKHECHVLIGHGDSWKHFNPHVVRDAAEVLAHPERRSMINARAKTSRLVNEPGGS